MPDTLTPLNNVSSPAVHGAFPPAPQPQICAIAQKSVDFLPGSEKHQRNYTPQPRGWMHPADDFFPEHGGVSLATYFPVADMPIRPVPAAVAAIPGPNDAPPLPACTPWGAHNGTHGYVERQPVGIVFLATCGVSGSRTTINVTLQPNAARELAAMVYAAYDTRVKRPSERWHQCWGNPMDVGGTVTVHGAGINVSFVSGSDEDSIKSAIHFRHLYAAHEAFTLLFGQADAWDAEYGEGDVA